MALDLGAAAWLDRRCMQPRQRIASIEARLRIRLAMPSLRAALFERDEHDRAAIRDALVELTSAERTEFVRLCRFAVEEAQP